MDNSFPGGAIVFATVGAHYYGFDVFSVPVRLAAGDPIHETRHTDGVSNNYNGRFVELAGTLAVTFVSERSGALRPYRSHPTSPEPLPHFVESLFHDRPAVTNGVVYFASAHEPPPAGKPFRSWSAVYSAPVDQPAAAPERLTPPGSSDLSPAISGTGEFVAVATYGSRAWKGEFHELETEVAVFRRSDPVRRVVVSGGRGGWPAWSGDSTVFFHRVAEDGWWSIFRVEISPELSPAGSPRRVTPPGVHALTPAATNDGSLIAVATRRKDSKFKQVELFDLETEKFIPVTAKLNPETHHYNPFFSGSGDRVGYHRFRGEAAGGESIIPNLRRVVSPAAELRMTRVHGSFPTLSPAGDLIAVNHDTGTAPGLMLLSSDGSHRWSLFQKSIAFQTCWSPVERGVIYTSIGAIFQPPPATVQIARFSFDPARLAQVPAGELVPSEMKILTRADSGNNAFPSCSPDGKWLVFRSGRSGRKNLYIMDAVDGEVAGGEIRRLTDGDWIDTMPSWSPDGELIAFSSNRHSPENTESFGLYLIRPDGTELRRVALAGPEGSEEARRERINHVCFSPDAKWLVFTGNLAGAVAEPVALPNQFQPYGDLFACRVADGGGLRRLTCNSYENGTPSWAPEDLVAEIGRLRLGGGSSAGEKLMGQFVEPLWLNCDNL